MKYIIEFLFLGLFVAVCFFAYQNGKTNKTIDQNKHKVDSVLKALTNQNHRTDTLIIRQETKLKTIENNYYNEKVNIINLSNDNQFNLLRSNIARYNYLLDTARR